MAISRSKASRRKSRPKANPCGVDRAAGKKGKKKENPAFVEGLPAKGVSAVKVPLSDIALEDETYRFRVTMRVSDLVESIGREGQQFPVLLRGSKPPYQIVSGFRRIAAIRKIGWDVVNAIVRNDISDVKAFKISFIENEMRKTLSDIDRANAIAKLKREAEKTTEEVANLYNLSTRQVQRLQSIVDFPKKLMNAMDDEKITTTHALLLNCCHKENPSVNLGEWIRRIQEKELSVEKLKKALKKEVKRPKGRKKLFEKRGKGFRMYPLSFNPESTSEREKKEMKSALEKALAILSK